MSVKVASNLFIASSFEKWGKFYQYLVSNIADFQRLGAQLVREAQEAQALRQISKLEEISAILSQFPIREYRLIGQYHLAWCSYRMGKDARAIFENVIENSTTYRSMALIDLATIELTAGNCDLGIKFCTEAIRQSNTISTIVNAARSMAVIQSVEGFHPQALKGLEAVAPLIRYATPLVRHQYYNSVAVELGEVGRLEEARNISNIVLASPYLFAYPEWRETSEEIQFREYRTSRSIVSFNHSALNINNVLLLPERNLDAGSEKSYRSPFHQQASVIVLKAWKEEKMVKEPNDDQTDDKSSLELDKMNNKDLIIEILQRTSKKDMSDKKLRKILEYVLEVESEPED